jgi:hypothetical protein
LPFKNTVENEGEESLGNGAVITTMKRTQTLRFGLLVLAA